MAGQHGNRNIVMQNLEVVKVDLKNHHLFLKGAVPGAKNGIVVVTK
jgi:large subunit ribosomal protein L3